MYSRWRPRSLGEAVRLSGSYGSIREYAESGRRDAQILLPYLDSGHVVLDAMCGAGRVARYVAPHVKKLYAADVSEEMLRYARIFCRGLDNIVYHRMNGLDMGEFGDGCLDLVYCFHSLQHMPREACYNYIREFYRILVEDGVLVFTLPSIYSPHHRQIFRNWVGVYVGEYPRISHPWWHTRTRLYSPEEVRLMLLDFDWSSLDITSRIIGAGHKILVVARK